MSLLLADRKSFSGYKCKLNCRKLHVEKKVGIFIEDWRFDKRIQIRFQTTRNFEL